MKVLVTGGTGYIGSHICIELLELGYEVIIADNLSNSNIKVIDKISEITKKPVTFYKINITNKEDLSAIFKENQIDSVIHLAGYKAVGESVEHPLMYYKNNLISTLILCEVMEENNVRNLIFSSSAGVYGDLNESPIDEKSPRTATNPYGRTKLMIEDILSDFHFANPKWSIGLLRYFNPVGAHKSGEIGEESTSIPNNLMPYITQVASGKLSKLNIFGQDYNTIDGTGVRDYIHVTDLAKGHVKALEVFYDNSMIEAINLGTGNGYSVLQLINTFQDVNNVKIPYEYADRRTGDADVSFAKVEKAKKILDWKAELSIVDMCLDAWKWENKNN